MARKNRNARKARRARFANQELVNESVRKEEEQVAAQTAARQVEIQSSFLEEQAPTLCLEQRIEPVPVRQIVTEGYQRVLNQRNVNAIAKNFDPARLGVLVVNHRADGTYAVLDGQHRLSALRKLGVMEANCIVLEGLTVEQEADYFRRQNENKQSLRVNDMFKAATWAGDEESLRIKDIMGKCGFTIGKSGRTMTICAVGALQQIVRLFGFETLELTLTSIAQTWPQDTVILRREMLAGVAEFWHRFAGRTDPTMFTSRMKIKVPVDMLMEAKTRSGGKLVTNTSFNKTMRFATCSVLVDAYNKHLSKDSKNRLSMQWDAKEGTENV